MVKALLKVVKANCGDGLFSSKLICTTGLKRGDVVGSFKEHKIVETSTYLTIQISKESHVEVQSELQYLNHSCDPNTKIDTNNYNVVALKDIPADQELTFFYPSTEWDMAQEFECWCGSPKCLKKIMGAKYISSKVLEEYYLSSHIKELKNLTLRNSLKD